MEMYVSMWLVGVAGLVSLMAGSTHAFISAGSLEEGLSISNPAVDNVHQGCKLASTGCLYVQNKGSKKERV